MNRILLIDDEEGIRIVWKRFHDLVEPVFRGQLEMDVSSDLDQGIERMRERAYDIIILDLKFQGVGGDKTIDWIFTNSERMPPIVVLTGDTDIWTRRRCMMAGASSFWMKMDATDNPDLFFKDVFNRYLARLYDQSKEAPATSA